MRVDDIIARFRLRQNDSWRKVAARIGLPYRRLHGWRMRGRIPASGITMLLDRARALGVPLAAEDFFPLCDWPQPPSVGSCTDVDEAA